MSKMSSPVPKTGRGGGIAYASFKVGEASTGTEIYKNSSGGVSGSGGGGFGVKIRRTRPVPQPQSAATRRRTHTGTRGHR